MAVTICPKGHHYNADINATCPFCEMENEGNSPVDPPVPTGPVDDDSTRIDIESESGQQPVVAWLVCVEGPDKGKDFCISSVKNTIGRSAESAVQLSDAKISRTGFPAVVIYDNRKSFQFYLASGDATTHSLVELNDSMLLGDSVLNAYDRIRVEDTVLIFVPFCGTDFHWEF